MKSEPKILYEDKDLLLVDKPAGWLVHGIYHKGEAKHDEETLVDWIAKRYPEIKDVGDPSAGSGQVPQHSRAGIVHRLDRETSGVMVIARSQESFVYLKKLFQTRDIHKTYQTLVWGRVKNESGVIDKPISIVDGSVRRTVFKGKMTRPAVTSYSVVKFLKSESGDEFTLLEVSPKTGRTHQIRVHFSSMGHSVVGDKLYGKKGGLEGLDRQFLHAWRIQFISPSGKQIDMKSELPRELKKTLRALTSESE